MAAYSAVLRGASKVYSVDRIDRRLELAKSIGAIPINYNTSGDAVEQIMALEPNGVNRAVDAVGFEARAADGSYDQSLVLQQTIKVTGNEGGIGVVGIYDDSSNSTGRPRAAGLPTSYPFDAASMFNKALQFHIGGVDARKLSTKLLQLIATGKATPSYQVTSEINITQVPEYYRRFSNWEEEKIVIRF